MPRPPSSSTSTSLPTHSSYTPPLLLLFLIPQSPFLPFNPSPSTLFLRIHIPWPRTSTPPQHHYTRCLHHPHITTIPTLHLPTSHSFPLHHPLLPPPHPQQAQARTTRGTPRGSGHIHIQSQHLLYIYPGPLTLNINITPLHKYHSRKHHTTPKSTTQFPPHLHYHVPHPINSYHRHRCTPHQINLFYHHCHLIKSQIRLPFSLNGIFINLSLNQILNSSHKHQSHVR
jgi:hypothetical protein